MPSPVAPRARGRSRRAIAVATLVAGLALGSASPTAFGWSARAHAMVGDIATRFLTREAAAAVAVLLVDDRAVDGRPSGRATLGEVSNWADELRLDPTQRATGAYHFDDIPICGVADKAAYCPDGRCGTAWFARELAVLGDLSQPARERNEALKWIVHLVGDLHQPLHASDNGDRGGNDVKATFLGRRADETLGGKPGTPYNLHAAWDRLIPYRAFDQAGGDARFLDDLPSAATRAAWEPGDVDAWTAESFELARDFVYPELPAAFACGRPLDGVVAIDARYDGYAEVVATEQIRKAGVRLAKVLNDTFAATAGR